MNGGNGYSSGFGAAHEPSEESGRSAWSTGETGAAAPPWASAQTQTSFAPPWATGGTQAPAPRRVGRVLAALAVAVLVGVSVGVGVWWFLRGTSLGTGTRTDAGPVPSVTAPASPTPSTSTSTPASAGYHRVQDPVGYTVDVPRGWTRSEKQGRSAPVVVYDAPTDGRRLQVFRIAEDTPAQSLDLAENDPGYGFARQPGYRVLDRASGTTWAELAYRYDDSDLGVRQAVDHRFQAADGTLYAIRATGPAALPPALVREPLTRALASFCPAATECH